MSVLQELQRSHQQRIERLFGQKPDPQPPIELDISLVKVPSVQRHRICVNIVCEKWPHNLTWEDIMSHARTRHLILPRRIAVWLTRQVTTLSWSQLARLFDRDHSTMIHSIRTIEKLREQPAIAETTNILLKGATYRIVKYAWDHRK